MEDDPKEFKDHEAWAQQLFDQGPNAARMSPSEFMGTRVMARVLEKAEGGKQKSVWRTLVMATSAMAAVLAVTLLFFGKRAYEGSVNQQLVIFVSGSGGKSTRQVSAVRVELPEGVKFKADGYPELERQAVLTLPWDDKYATQPLPVVIEGEKAGTQTVKIHYLDPEEREVSTQDVRIKFKPQQEQRI